MNDDKIDHARTLRRIAASRDEELARLRAEHLTDVAAVHTEIQQAREQHIADADEMRERHSQCLAELAAVRAELQDARDRHSSDVAEMRDNAGQLAAELAVARAGLEDARERHCMEVSETRESHDREIKDGQAKNEQLQAELEQARDRSSDFENEVAVLSFKIAEEAKINLSLTSRLEDLTNSTRRQERDQCERWLMSLSDVESQLEAAEEQLSQSRALADALHTKNSLLLNDISTHEETIATLKESEYDVTEDARAKSVEFEATIKSLEEQLRARNVEVARLRSSVDSLNEEIWVFQEYKKEHVTSEDSANRELAELKGKHRAIEGRFENLSKDHAELQASAFETGGELVALKQNLIILTGRLEDVQARNESLELSEDSKSKELNRVNREIENAIRAKTEAETEFEQINGDVRARLSLKEAQCASLQGKLETVQEDLEETTSSLEALRKSALQELLRDDARLDEATAASAAHVCELECLRKTVARLERDCETSDESIETLMHAVDQIEHAYQELLEWSFEDSRRSMWIEERLREAYSMETERNDGGVDMMELLLGEALASLRHLRSKEAEHELLSEESTDVMCQALGLTRITSDRIIALEEDVEKFRNEMQGQQATALELSMERDRRDRESESLQHEVMSQKELLKALEQERVNLRQQLDAKEKHDASVEMWMIGRDVGVMAGQDDVHIDRWRRQIRTELAVPHNGEGLGDSMPLREPGIVAAQPASLVIADMRKELRECESRLLRQTAEVDRLKEELPLLQEILENERKHSSERLDGIVEELREAKATTSQLACLQEETATEKENFSQQLADLRVAHATRERNESLLESQKEELKRELVGYRKMGRQLTGDAGRDGESVGESRLRKELQEKNVELSRAHENIAALMGEARARAATCKGAGIRKCTEAPQPTVGQTQEESGGVPLGNPLKAAARAFRFERAPVVAEEAAPPTGSAGVSARPTPPPSSDIRLEEMRLRIRQLQRKREGGQS
eukprot:Polyplicarium_translucidae@DN1295_c0_g1_i1.p1